MKGRNKLCLANYTNFITAKFNFKFFMTCLGVSHLNETCIFKFISPFDPGNEVAVKRREIQRISM